MSKRRVAGIVDVASAAGVSAATVSRYFNTPERVGSRSRSRIAEAIRELGYVRNRVAGSLHNRPSGAVGLVVPTVDNAIFAEMIEAFSARLRDYDYTMLIASHGYDLRLEAQLVRTLLERRADAVALVGLDHEFETMSMLGLREVPSLLLWNCDRASHQPCIGVDNEQAGWLVTRYLVDLGHRDFALISGPVEANDRARGRRQGALRALAEAGLRPAPEWQHQCRYDVGEAKALAQRVLTGRRRPTAIVCGNDIIAHGVLYGAQSIGRRVPLDVSVVGIGDFRVSAHIEPGLTTVRIPAPRIGQAAADAIVGLIAGEVLGSALLIEPELKVRGSSGPARS